MSFSSRCFFVGTSLSLPCFPAHPGPSERRAGCDHGVAETEGMQNLNPKYYLSSHSVHHHCFAEVPQPQNLLLLLFSSHHAPHTPGYSTQSCALSKVLSGLRIPPSSFLENLWAAPNLFMSYNSQLRRKIYRLLGPPGG